MKIYAVIGILREDSLGIEYLHSLQIEGTRRGNTKLGIERKHDNIVVFRIEAEEEGEVLQKALEMWEDRYIWWLE